MYKARTQGIFVLDLQSIIDAQKSIQRVVKNTPFEYSKKLSDICFAEIYLKKENLQNTGSFKLRGAFNKISKLSDEQKTKGVIAASAGNHAQGVAFSANYFKINSTIVMPEATPLTKVTGVRNYGSQVILFGKNYDEAYRHANELSQKNNQIFVHPFADDDVIAGQGTIALEILDKIEDIDMIIAPIGGGGLISGIAKAAKANNPNIRIIGVTASGAPALKQSFDAKLAIDGIEVRTIADGIAVRDVNPKMLSLVLELVDDIVDVNDEEIANAILFLLESGKLLVEGAGATPVAAILHDKIPNIKGKKIALVVSGGNIDVTMLNLIIEKGLLKSYRKMKFIATLVDKPGSLAKLTSILSNLGANIVQIDYDRTSVSLEYGDANVIMAIETKGQEHQQNILRDLIDAGYKIKTLI